MKEKLKNQKAITLIALVVTIVVLLILAGITINIVFSNNGVIKQAQEAKNVQENAQEQDQQAVDNLMNQAEYIMATKYTITFNANGGILASGTQDIVVIQGNAIGTEKWPSNPTKSGNVFQGWFTQATGGTQVTSSTIPTGSITLYAQWRENNYEVTYNTDGGSAVASQTVVSGGKATKPTTNPTKANYVFKGWYSSSSYENEFDFNTEIREDKTIYAKFVRIINFKLRGINEIAEEGMTWYEWCNDVNYGLGEWMCNSNESNISHHSRMGQVIYHTGNFVLSTELIEMPTGSSTIIENREYDYEEIDND